MKNNEESLKKLKEEDEYFGLLVLILETHNLFNLIF